MTKAATGGAKALVEWDHVPLDCILCVAAVLAAAAFRLAGFMP